MFNTALSGYQEVLTDPSYAGQIVTFTNPHIGNYGVNATDFESRGLFCRGVVVRDLARRHSNRRAEGDLDALLRLPRHRRDHRHRHAPADPPDPHDWRGRLAPSVRPTTSRRCAPPRRPSRAPTGSTSSPRSRRPSRTRCRLTNGAPARASSPTTTASSARSCATSPRSGRSTSCRRRPRPPKRWPANPTASSCPTVPAIQRASPQPRTSSPSCSARRFPCSASASAISCWPRRSAATTVKLPFGHHGANHPVQDVATGRIEITSQNHNFAVAADELAVDRHDDPRQPQRRRLRGARGHPRQRLLRAAPSRGRTRARTTAPTCSSASPSGWPGAVR